MRCREEQSRAEGRDKKEVGRGEVFLFRVVGRGVTSFPESLHCVIHITGTLISRTHHH